MGTVLLICEMASRALLCVLQAMMTCHPFWASSMVLAYPQPVLEPVTMAIFCDDMLSMLIGLSVG